MSIKRWITALCASLLALTATLVAVPTASATARADSNGPAVGKCLTVAGDLGFSPGLTLLPRATTMTMQADGSNCVGLEVLSDDGLTTIGVDNMTINGTFTGQGSTTLSSYSGNGSITWHLANGTQRTDTFSATCAAGVLAICPMIGQFTSGPMTGGAVEIAPTPVNLDLVGPVTSLPYLELAYTYAYPYPPSYPY